MANNKNKASSARIAGEIGAAALAAAAAGATYYFYGSKDAKKYRKAAAAWAENLRRDVMKEAKSLKTLDAKTVSLIVDDAVAAYNKMGKADAKELARAAAELKSNWQRVAVAKLPAVKKAAKRFAGAMKKGASRSKKVATKAKKTTKKGVSRPKKAVKKVTKRRR